MDIADLIDIRNETAYKRELDILNELLKDVPNMAPQYTKDKIRASLSNLYRYIPGAANERNLDIIESYTTVAKERAKEGKDPSAYLDAAKIFVRSCFPKERKKYAAQMTLIMSRYYRKSGDVDACLSSLGELADVNSGVPKEIILDELDDVIDDLESRV